jgi:hypothetical protein
MVIYMDVPAHPISYAIEAPSKPGDNGEHHAIFEHLEWPSGTSTATGRPMPIDDLLRMIFATVT